MRFITTHYDTQVRLVSVGAVPFLELFGIVAGGWQLARAALVAQQRLAEGDGEPAFYRSKLLTTVFYAEHLLPRANGLAHAVMHGGEAAMAMADEHF
ncbi:hypothetical protein D3C80_2020480 [compost metagenome]